MSWTGDDRPPPGWMRLEEVATLVSHVPRQFGHSRCMLVPGRRQGTLWIHSRADGLRMVNQENGH